MFDLTISLGTIIQTVALVGSAAYFIWGLKTKLEIMEVSNTAMSDDINSMKLELQKLTDVVIEQAKQNQRLAHIEERIQELHNKVFNTNRRSK
jgi:hypothetical protein